VNRFQNWMRSPFGRVVAGLVVISYCHAALGVSYAGAQVQQTITQSATPGAEYRVGPGDHLFLSVPQRQDLNRELVIDEHGAVTLPLVGDVVLTGLTKGEIETRLLQSLREYYPSIKSVEITVTRAMSNVIFVSGDVRIPGKYSITESINVWEAIREASSRTARAADRPSWWTCRPRWTRDRWRSCPCSSPATPSWCRPRKRSIPVYPG
jgi:protein involved in polysaccharide export with SLBB domain